VIKFSLSISVSYLIFSLICPDIDLILSLGNKNIALSGV